MVRFLIYHGSSPKILCMCYVKWQIFYQGEFDVNYLSITEWAKKLQELGYMNCIGYWYKLDNEVSDHGFAHIHNDNDVVHLIGRIICENRRVLHLYVEHEINLPNLIEPTNRTINCC